MNDEICCREMLVGWWYRKGTETLVSAPLHLQQTPQSGPQQSFSRS